MNLKIARFAVTREALRIAKRLEPVVWIRGDLDVLIDELRNNKGQED